jgi:glycerate kinase
VTGEGGVDRQTVFGKGPIEVALRARAADVPVALLAGTLGEGWESVLDEGISIVEEIGTGLSIEQSMQDTPRLLRLAARRVMAKVVRLRR